MKYRVLFIPLGLVLGVTAGIGYTECTAKSAIAQSISPFLFPKRRYNTVETFSNAYDSCLPVHTSITLEEKCNGSFLTGWFGSGVLLQDSQTKDKYVLSVEHLTADEFESCKNPKKRIKVESSNTTVGEAAATTVKEDEKNDLILYKVEGDLQATPFKGKIARETNQGDYMLGFGFPSREKRFYIAKIEKKTEQHTTLDMNIWFGNSGGPAFLYTHEKMELAGLAMHLSGNITPIEKLQDFLEGTVLEDDYLQE
ncbi:trypsin-like peptidase domain-containing protein [Candidatus Woesearchaeota archaeon]|nr:trypsin-like peptidase domain-containing protein [Candidatus Woesearchaeota archaeon]